MASAEGAQELVIKTPEEMTAEAARTAEALDQVVEDTKANDDGAFDQPGAPGSGIQEDSFDVPHPFDEVVKGEKQTVETELPDELGATTEETETQVSDVEPDGNFREIKANGQMHKIDFGDQKELDRLVSHGIGARKAFTDLDRANKRAEKQDEELAKFRTTWDKYEKASARELYEMKSGKKWEDVMQSEREYAEKYSSASDEEKQSLDLRRELDQVKGQMDLINEQRDKDQAQHTSEMESAQHKELNSILHPEFAKHDFSEVVKDEALADKLNSMLWRTTLSNLTDKYGEGYEITPSQAREEFNEVAELMNRHAKSAATKEVKVQTERQQSNARKQARTASTRNYKQENLTDFASLAKDPTALWRAMTGGK